MAKKDRGPWKKAEKVSDFARIKDLRRAGRDGGHADPHPDAPWRGRNGADTRDRDGKRAPWKR